MEAEASGADILDRASALQTGVFGVLYTMTKEKYNTGYRFLLLKLVLDYLQLFTLVFAESEPWVFNRRNVMWKIASVVNIDQAITPLGYGFFVALLYVMVGLLCCMVGLSLWVAWCFKNRSFPFVWPIKLLRVYSNLFFQILDVLTLSLFQVPFNCRFFGYDSSQFNTLAGYPEVVCTSFPHIVHIVSSGLSLAVFVASALLNLGADFELSPVDKAVTALADGGVELQAFGLKFAMTFVSYGIGWRSVRLSLLLVLSAALTATYLRSSPHLAAWLNHLRTGLYASITLTAALALALVNGPDKAAHPQAAQAHHAATTRLLWALIAPAGLAGAAASYVRLNLWSAYVLRRFRAAPPGEKPRRIYRFEAPREVELVARCCRRWLDPHREVLDRAAVAEGEAVVKAGLALFPGSPAMLILYSNYLIDVLDASTTGYSQMAAAKQAEPGLMQRFAIFVREQEQLQRMSSARGGGEGGVDLLSYVEYQKNHRLVIRAHKDALLATRTFWQTLLHQKVRFTVLAAALNDIERTVQKAESAYKMVLSRYPGNAKLVRTYARFLENVINDPWRAARYFTEAERLAEAAEADDTAGADMAAGGGEAGLEGRLLHRVDERVNAVFMINANGIIQMANKNACTLLGYNKGDLDGKNINTIMPPPFSQRHNKYVRQYVNTGRDAILNQVVTLPALHKHRYVVPMRIGVTKVSGAAESSTFMGVLEPVPLEPNEAHVYLMPGGTIAAVDRAFVDWFAKGLEDCIAQHLADLAADAGDAVAIRLAVERSTADWRAAYGPGVGTGSVAAQAPQAASAALPSPSHNVDNNLGSNSEGGTEPEETLSVWIRHKYAPPVRVTLHLSHAGVGRELLVCATLVRTDPPTDLVLTDGRGRIQFMTSDLASALGATAEGLKGLPVSDVMPQPWAAMHVAEWFREAEGSLAGAGMPILGDHASHETKGSHQRGPGAWQHYGPAGNHGSSAWHNNGSFTTSGAAGGAAAGGGNGALGRSGSRRHSNSHMYSSFLTRTGTGWESAWAVASAGGYGGVYSGMTPCHGSCLAGATVILGSSPKVQDYYRVQVSSRGEDPSGGPMRVIMVRRSTLASALDERRLALVVDAATGTVLEAGHSSLALFGFKPAALVGRNVADVVSALRPPASANAADPLAVASGETAAVAAGTDDVPASAAQLLCRMAAASMAVGGTSWRVGVMPPANDEDLEALGVLRAAFLAKQTRTAVMEVEVLLPRGVGGGEEEEGAGGGRGAYFRRSCDAPPSAINPGRRVGSVAIAEDEGVTRAGASALSVPTFKEMQERGALSAHAAAAIEAELLALASGRSAVGSTSQPQEGSTADYGGKRRSGTIAHGGLTLRINLWRSDSLCGLLEVDGSGEVVAVSHSELHQAGLLWGRSTMLLSKANIRSLLAIPADVPVLTALMEPPTADGATKRGALKGSRAGPGRVGPQQLLTVKHPDGQPVDLTVTAIVKDASGSSLLHARLFVFVKLRSPSLTLNHESLLLALRGMELGRDQYAWLAKREQEGSTAVAGVARLAVLAPPPMKESELTISSSASSSDSAGSDSEEGSQLERGEAVGMKSHAQLPDPAAEYEEHGVRQASKLPLPPVPRALTRQASSKKLRVPAELLGLGDNSTGHTGHNDCREPGASAPTVVALAISPMGSQNSGDGPERNSCSRSADIGTNGKDNRAAMAGPNPDASDRTSSGDKSNSRDTAMITRSAPVDSLSKDRKNVVLRTPSMQPSIGGGFGGGKTSRPQSPGVLTGRRPVSPSSRPRLAINVPNTFGSDEDDIGGQAGHAAGGAASPRPAGKDSALHLDSRLDVKSFLSGAQPKEGQPGNGSAAGAHRSPAGGDAGDAGGQDKSSEEEDGQQSTVSGMEGLGPNGYQADYRRGKRYKKLSSMLSSASVQRATRNFRWQALLANLVQVASNLMSFVLLTVLLKAQLRDIERITHTANGLCYAHELIIDFVKLDNTHRGLYPNTSWYSPATLDSMAENLKEKISAFSNSHTSCYLETGKGRITDIKDYDHLSMVHTWNYPHLDCMDFFSVTPPRVELRRDSLWQLGNTIIQRSLEVHHLHEELKHKGVVLLYPYAALGIPLKNATAPSNGDAYTDLIVARHLAGAYVLSGSSTPGGAHEDISNITDDTPVDPLMPGNGETPSWMTHWHVETLQDGTNWTVPELRSGLRWSDAFRFVMVNGPVQLYEGYTDMMVALVGLAVDDSDAVNRVQLVLMLVEGCALAAVLLLYMWWLQHHVTLQRYKLYGLFIAVPVGMIRTLASKTITVNEGSTDEGSSSEGEPESSGPGPQQRGSVMVRQESNWSLGNTSGRGLSMASLVGVLQFVTARRRLSSMTGISTRNNSKKPKRHMVPDSRDALKLLLPFAFWGVAICIIYAIGYYYLNQVQAPVNLLSVISSVTVSLHRLELYSLLTCSEMAAPAREVLRGLLAEELSSFQAQWDVMMYGANETTARLDRRFSRIHTGASFMLVEDAHILYRSTECATYGYADLLPCPDSASSFMPVTSRGLESMVERLMEDVEGLLRESLADANINSTRLAYISTIGPGPLEAALRVIHRSTMEVVHSYFDAVEHLHIAALVLSWALALFFVVAMLRPLLRRNKGETARIAKMLAQLPTEVDIEGMVQRMLLPPPKGRTSRRGSALSDDPAAARAAGGGAEVQSPGAGCGGMAAVGGESFGMGSMKLGHGAEAAVVAMVAAVKGGAGGSERSESGRIKGAWL